MFKILHYWTKFQYLKPQTYGCRNDARAASRLHCRAYAPDQLAGCVQIARCDLEDSISHPRQEVRARFRMSAGVEPSELEDQASFSAEIVHDERADAALRDERISSKGFARQ